MISKTITVTVTQEMINKGVPNLPGSCPIALGFRALGYDTASVYQSWSLITKDGQIIRLVNPPGADLFINLYDHYRLVVPGRFEFEYEQTD